MSYTIMGLPGEIKLVKELALDCYDVAKDLEKSKRSTSVHNNHDDRKEEIAVSKNYTRLLEIRDYLECIHTGLTKPPQPAGDKDES